MPIRVLLADDHEVVRSVIRAYFEKRKEFLICAEAEDGLTALKAARRLQPDLLILDVVMPGLNGIEVATVLKTELPAAKIILFTMFGDQVGENLASAAGIDIVLSKPDGLTVLMEAVDKLVQGLKPVGPDLTTASAALPGPPSDGPLPLPSAAPPADSPSARNTTLPDDPHHQSASAADDAAIPPPAESSSPGPGAKTSSQTPEKS